MDENKGVGYGWIIFLMILILGLGATNRAQNARIANLEQQVTELRSRR